VPAVVAVAVPPHQPAAVAKLNVVLVLAPAAAVIFKAVDEVRPFLSQINSIVLSP
jgi:hypothetical protein